MDASCVFCKIVSGALPSHAIHETAEHMAFMDIYPPTWNGVITMPTVLITTKEHLGSNVFEDLDRRQYTSLMGYTRYIAKAVQRTLDPLRVAMVFEGMEVPHIHPKLYPLFKESYPGYLSTEKSLGNKDVRASDSYLEDIAAKVRKTLASPLFKLQISVDEMV